LAEPKVKLLSGKCRFLWGKKMERNFILISSGTGFPRHMCMFSSCSWEEGCHTCSRKCCSVFSKISFFQAICSSIDLRITNQMASIPNHLDFDLSNTDAMLETFDPITKLLNLMNALLDMADPQLRAFLDQYVNFVEHPVCPSCTLTFR